MDNDTIYRLVTFNCKNVKRSIDNIRDICKTSDIIALQETWLFPEEIPLLNTISPEFSYTGVSAMNAEIGILRGRPYGGVALLWRSSVFRNVVVVQCNNPRICAIKVALNDKSFLVMCVYMPTDEATNLVEFTDILSAMSAIIDSNSVDNVYLLGDYNSHPYERFYYELSNFCTDQEWSCIDIDTLGISSNTYTFISEAHSSKRWLDHCLVTKAAIDTIKKVYVKYDVYWSDHIPLFIECNFNVIVSKK